MARPVHFEIHAGDPGRAAAFYRDVLGWQLDRWGEEAYWVIVTGPEDQPGINGGLLPRRGPAPEPGQPVNGYVVTTQVDDLDATLARAHDRGATTALDKERMPGIGWIAYIHDPEGNLLGLLQPEQPGG
jgi:predicted enzyme related to lactoylglutathione lyase